LHRVSYGQEEDFADRPDVQYAMLFILRDILEEQQRKLYAMVMTALVSTDSIASHGVILYQQNIRAYPDFRLTLFNCRVHQPCSTKA
jgi:hypothetical protein